MIITCIIHIVYITPIITTSIIIITTLAKDLALPLEEGEAAEAAEAEPEEAGGVV